MNITSNYLASGRQPAGTQTVRSSLGSVFHRLAAWWTLRRNRDREMADLYRFSDRELWDVGLSRSDIMSIEHGTYRRD
jgi:uncharacterized protein YjiS (DUF1127 family)